MANINKGLKLYNLNVDCYTDDILELYDRELYDYIELYVVPNNGDLIGYWEQIKKDKNIPFIIHHAHSSNGFNLALKECKKQNLDIYKQTLVYADKLDVDTIIFHSGMNGDIKESARQLKAFGESRAVVENKPYKPVSGEAWEYCVGCSVDDMMLILSECGCGFCLDFGHAICAANTFKIEPYSFIESFLSLKPKMYHLTDVYDMSSEIDAHPHLGDGVLDMKRIFSYIKDGSKVTFETIKNSKTDLKDFEKDMLWIRDFI